ncbi:hypothetical protein PsorP6_000351 [Peronosclerospora sorghi]|uniref:Uncharacterized protein n=1 Tax=Peronosclerospora sorghi TaxID=230839 RepID=A0ACC0WWJ8_9STRA|nr:hypothetical protein PsorP6_000351 [Peronosclerospora sorghi]
MTSYTGKFGASLLLTPSVPLCNPHDVTKEYVCTPDILDRYLVVHGKINTVDNYIHVVYAPAQRANENIFSVLYPLILMTIHNILLWGLNKLYLRAYTVLKVVRNFPNGYMIYIGLIPGGFSSRTFKNSPSPTEVPGLTMSLSVLG